jgi:hypothetical protein
LGSALAVVGVASLITWIAFSNINAGKEPLAIQLKSSFAHVTGLFAFLLLGLAVCAVVAYFLLKPSGKSGKVKQVRV